MQLYPRSHESSRGVGQGQDFSILSALKLTSPDATTFLDLGIMELTSAKVTAAMLLAFSALSRSNVFTASALDDTETTTCDHGSARSPNALEEPPPIDLKPQPARTVAQMFLDSITFSASKPLPQARDVIEEHLHSVSDDDHDTSAPRATHATFRTLPIEARL